MSRNIITYNLNSEVVTVNGVYLNKEQSIEITKIIEEKDQRIAELEKENERAGRLCDKLNTDYQNAHRDNIHYAQELTRTINELKYSISENNEFKQENTELKQKLENAIFPKYKIGKLVWIADFIENEYGIFQVPLQKVVSGIMQRINDFIYEIEGEIYLERDIFATEQEARDRLEELKNGKD